ncbi:MAG: hypothetical protein OER56_05605 [Hyphomicrobiales bacterium]|nr:hypothetical protein [Hyphomicrobiales bacterium]
MPDARISALLERHRPRLYLPQGHVGPIDFYRDYIAHGVLRDGQGKVISDKVTPELLNQYKEAPRAEFIHKAWPAGYAPLPVLHARARTATIDLGEGPRSFQVLSYHAVFARSGLPAGLLGWQTIALGLVGDLDDWHQLDHYTAANIVLDDTDTPVALILQQHNYHRTYLFGEKVPIADDGRPKIDVAIRSNELYPHRPGRTNRRAVSFLNRKAWLYMIGAGPRLFLTADDVTQPARELKYKLRFLVGSDSFYTFKGYLGARRWLMGRSGPPGAEYKTLPKLMNFERQLLVGYWRDGNSHDIGNLTSAIEKPDFHLEFANAQGAVFRANLLCVKRWRADCAFQ